MSFYNYRDYDPLNGFDEDLNEIDEPKTTELTYNTKKDLEIYKKCCEKIYKEFKITNIDLFCEMYKEYEESKKVTSKKSEPLGNEAFNENYLKESEEIKEDYYYEEEKDESESECEDDDKIKDPDYEYESETSESDYEYESESESECEDDDKIKDPDYESESESETSESESETSESDYEEEKDESEDDDDKIKDPDYEYESENNSSEYDSDYDSENDFENEATNNDKYRYSLKIIKFCECGSNTTKYISNEQDIINFLYDEFFYRYQEYCGDVEADIYSVIKRVMFLMTQYNVYDDYNTWNDREYVLSKQTTSGFFLSRSEEFRKNIKIIDLFELC